jgi:hypothetical protein
MSEIARFGNVPPKEPVVKVSRLRELDSRLSEYSLLVFESQNGACAILSYNPHSNCVSHTAPAHPFHTRQHIPVQAVAKIRTRSAHKKRKNKHTQQLKDAIIVTAGSSL